MSLAANPRPAILRRFKLHRRLAVALGRDPQMRNKAPKGRTTAPETVSRLVTRGSVCTQTPGIQEATCETRDTLLRVASHAGLSHVIGRSGNAPARNRQEEFRDDFWLEKTGMEISTCYPTGAH